MLPTIEILMATYNGAAYLQQQINSLLTQTYDNWQLLVHDDGSTDAPPAAFWSNMLVRTAVSVSSMTAVRCTVLPRTLCIFCIMPLQTIVFFAIRMISGLKTSCRYCMMLSAHATRQCRKWSTAMATCIGCDSGRVEGRSVLKAPQTLGGCIVFERRYSGMCSFV